MRQKGDIVMAKVYYCFPGGKHKALTMSYDDGRTEDRRLVSIFNKYGIKGTFNINSGIFHNTYGEKVQPEEFLKLYEGHEIACHTVTHPTIARCPLENVAEEVLEDRKKLEAIMGQPVMGLAYPNGSTSPKIRQMLPMMGIRYARVVGSTDDFAIPEDFYQWKATCHHNHNLLENGQRFVELFKKQYLYLMYVWGHSYEFTDKNNWEVMEEFCKLAGGRDDTWYATNIQIVDYMEVLDRLQFFADSSKVYNPSAQSAWLSNEKGEIIEAKGGCLTVINMPE